MVGDLIATGVVIAGVPFHLDIIVTAIVGILAGLVVDSLGGDAWVPTGYNPATAWLVIALAGVLTPAIRGSFIYLFGRIDDVPPAVGSALGYVPVVAFTAPVSPALLTPSDSLMISVGNDKLVTDALAALVAWYAECALATILVGMGALWVLRFVAWAAANPVRWPIASPQDTHPAGDHDHTYTLSVPTPLLTPPRWRGPPPPADWVHRRRRRVHCRRGRDRRLARPHHRRPVFHARRHDRDDRR